MAEVHRILLFGSQITTGGAQRVLLDQADWFQSRGFAVSAVFYYDKDGLLPDWRRRYPFPITVLSVYRKGEGIRNSAALPAAIGRFRRLLREFRPDVLETFTHDANILGMVGAAGLGVPVRVAAHHGQFARLGRGKKTLHRLIVNGPLTSVCVCVSERARNQAISEGIRADKLVVIENGVRPIRPDAAARASLRSALGVRGKLILTVGRLVPEKAQELLIDAMAAPPLSGLNEALTLAIAGEGPRRAFLTERIRERDVSDRCALLGNRDDVPALLNAADLFVLCSRTEGMPIAMMEAMSLGLPVIGTDLEGIRALIGEDAGRIVPVDDADGLAEAIRRTVSDADEAMKMGVRAAERIRGAFTLETSLTRYLGLFRELRSGKAEG